MNQNELELENYFTEELGKLGWKFVRSDLLDRIGSDEQLLELELASKIESLNESKGITDEDVKHVINELKFTTTSEEGAKKILNYYKNGVPVKYENDGVVKFTKLFDYDDIENNSFTLSRQVIHSGAERIKNDIILYVNGIPLVTFRLV